MVNGENRRKVKKSIEKVTNQIKHAEKEIEKEILFNVPNTLTLLRLLLAFVFVYLLFTSRSKWIVFGVFVIAALTDWFDGFFARKLNQKTKIGARMDQVIDRVFTGVIVLALIIYLIINNKPSPESIFIISSKNVFLLLFLISSREIIGIPGFLIALIRNKDPYQVRYIGKLTTFIQSVALGGIIINVLAFPLSVITCIVGIIAGFDYLRYSLS